MITRLILTALILLLSSTSAVAGGGTYSKATVGASFGDLSACVAGSAGCFDDGTTPSIDTDRGYYFTINPVAVRKPLFGNIHARLESELAVSKREFDASLDGEKSISANGDVTNYGLGGNILLDIETDFHSLTPYVGIGGGVEYSKVNMDVSGLHRRGGPVQIDTHDDFGRYWKYIVGLDVPIHNSVRGNIEYNYRKTDRFRDNDSQGNWNLNDEHILNAGVSVFW